MCVCACFLPRGIMFLCPEKVAFHIWCCLWGSYTQWCKQHNWYPHLWQGSIQVREANQPLPYLYDHAYSHFGTTFDCKKNFQAEGGSSSTHSSSNLTTRYPFGYCIICGFPASLLLEKSKAWMRSGCELANVWFWRCSVKGCMLHIRGQVLIVKL